MHSPVSLYLKIRDLYHESALLEAAEYRTPESSFSFIGFCPIAGFSVNKGKIETKLPDGKIEEHIVVDADSIYDNLKTFMSSFNVIDQNKESGKLG